MEVICFQLLNDFSGSPMVLSLAIAGLLARGHRVTLYTSRSDQKGCLSDIPGLEYRFFPYQRSGSRWATLATYLFGQLSLFLELRRFRKRRAVFYVNTLLPFGAALAGRLYGHPVVYHLHETSIRPRLLKWFLFRVVQACAQDSIYVSRFLMDAEPVSGGGRHIVPNALKPAFTDLARTSQPDPRPPYRVAMICSLKGYKGVNEFVALARRMPDLEFLLVLNAPEAEMAAWVETIGGAPNLSLMGPQKDVHPIYSRIHVLLSLSRPDQWVETFGLTALEAMAYGVPVVVPECGGIAELVEDGREGFKCSVYDLEGVASRIRTILATPEAYAGFSANARRRAQDFDSAVFEEKLEGILQNALAGGSGS